MSTQETMRAVFYDHTGPAAAVLQIGQLPLPRPGPGEVLIRVTTTGVNPSDVKSRSGAFGPMPFPRIVPHSDGAGVIEAVGQGVPTTRIGRRVWTWNAQWRRPFGTASRYVTLASEQAVDLPDNVSDPVGACLGIPALTAQFAVEMSRLNPGQTVLVQGGAGAVGHYAVQMAKQRGARVIATVGGAQKAEHALSAGADAVIDRKAEDVAGRIAEITGGKGVERVLEVDLTANAALYPAILSSHARVVVFGVSGVESTLPARWLLRASSEIRFILVYELTAAERIAAVAALTKSLTDGTLSHTIGLTLPLAKAAEGHEAVERGSVMGNVVLEIE